MTGGHSRALRAALLACMRRWTDTPAAPAPTPASAAAMPSGQPNAATTTAARRPVNMPAVIMTRVTLMTALTFLTSLGLTRRRN